MNSDPLLISGKYWKISLNRYETKARIGAYQHERLLPQRLRLNVSVYVEKGAAPVSELSEVFNYDRVIEAIEAVVQESPIDLQETLLQRHLPRRRKSVYRLKTENSRSAWSDFAPRRLRISI